MKLLIEIAAFASMAISALLWFFSAAIRLTRIGPGLEELDHIANLSNDLQKMARWNFWAAGTTAVSVLFQIWTRFA
jgi:hypothetical protein